MTWSYTPGSGAGLDLVRLIITDTDQSNPIFQDEEINAYLGLESQDVRLAAADALDTIASSQALILKVVKALDIQTDGQKTAQAIRDHAQALREQVYNDPGFEIAEQVLDDFTLRERLWKQVLRLFPA